MEDNKWHKDKAFIINNFYDADSYAITITKKDNHVIAKCYIIDASFLLNYNLDDVIGDGECIKYGDGLKFVNPKYFNFNIYEDDLIFKIEVWGKYYFPSFTNNENQWYHRLGTDEVCHIDLFHFLMKVSYNEAINLIDIY